LLVDGSTQVPLQSISPAGQETAHTPEPLQTWPDGQAVPALAPVHAPEAPQNCRSVIGLTQVPLHSTRPA
jgi:hypothetical protein